MALSVGFIPFFVKFFIRCHGGLLFTSIGGGSRFLGGLLLDHVEVNIQGKFFLFPFLVLTYYHNSIYMSIAKKKIVGFPTIYFFNSISLISSSSDLLDRKSGAER